MEIWLPILFLFIAFFYSSVGFGGGSSYLAILSIFLTEFYEIRSIALVLNLVVVSIGTFNFIRNKQIDVKAFWPFIVLSMPVAFLGAQIKLSESIFFLILGGALLTSGGFMLLQAFRKKINEKKINLIGRMGLGSGIGLLSGITGIGGGIFLSPTLNLIGWKTPKTVAALASLFILVNSAAGLTGLFVSDSFVVDKNLIFPLIVSVVVGGSVGSYLTNSKFKINTIRIMTAILVTYVGLRLVLLHGFGIQI